MDKYVVFVVDSDEDAWETLGDEEKAATYAADRAFGELAGQDDRIARPQPHLVQRCVEFDLVGAAADVGDQVVDQPVAELGFLVVCLLIARRGHTEVSIRASARCSTHWASAGRLSLM